VEHGTHWQPSPWRWLSDGIFEMMGQVLANLIEIQSAPDHGGVEGRINLSKPSKLIA
jgi:hypothetical protein